MYAASTANARNNGRSWASHESPLPPMPMTSRTTWMPTSCSAMYGIVARMPVTATASASGLESNRPRMKSAGVT